MQDVRTTPWRVKGIAWWCLWKTLYEGLPWNNRRFFSTLTKSINTPGKPDAQRIMQLKNFVFYFMLGGGIVSTVTFLGSQGKGLLAAFVATFPTMTVLTFALIHGKAGQSATLDYAKGLLFMTPPWIFLCDMSYPLIAKMGLSEISYCWCAHVHDPRWSCKCCYTTS